MNRYGDTRESRPAARIVTDPITVDSRGRYIVTDWQQSRHAFNSLEKALAFASGLYGRKPKSIQAAKHGPVCRWANPPSPIVWHTERHTFSSGRA